MTRKSRADWKVYKNVFDKFTDEQLLKLQGQRHFDELLRPLLLGKEANVFIASKADGFVIVKIYRLHTANFNKMHEYLSHDERYLDLKGNKRRVILSWVQREFANLRLAREHVRVPTPHAVLNNVLVMDLIGHGDQPAPMLKDERPTDPQAFYDECRQMLDTLWDAGLVHGDVSAFNILNNDDTPWLIDFSQATTIKNPRAKELFERDVENLNTYCKKLGVTTR